MGLNNALAGEPAVEVVADGAARVAEMVARLESCERVQPAWQPGQGVEVDQPQVDAVGEGAPYPLASGVRDDGVVECRRERGDGHAGLPTCAE
jgi:hypothetical protein